MDGSNLTIEFLGGTLQIPVTCVPEDSALAHLMTDSKCDGNVILPACSIPATQYTLDNVAHLLRGGSTSAITESQWIEIAAVADLLDIKCLTNAVVAHYQCWQDMDRDKIASFYSSVDGLADKVDFPLARRLFGDKIETVEDLFKQSTKKGPWSTTGFGGHCGMVFCLTPMKDGRLASGSSYGTIKLWDTNTNTCTGTLIGHTSHVTCLLSLPQDRLVSGCYRTIKVWNTVTTTCTATLIGHVDGVICLAALPDGRIASGSCDWSIKLWDLVTNRCTATLTGHTRSIVSLAVLPDGRLAAGSGTISIWDTSTNTRVATLEGTGAVVRSLAVTNDGRLAASYSDKVVSLWDIDRNTCTDVFRTSGEDASLHVLPNGNIVATGRLSFSVQVFDIASNTTIATDVYPTDLLQNSCVCYTIIPDGRVAYSQFRGSIKLWDMTGVKPTAELVGYTDGARLVGLLDDGRAVVRFGGYSFWSVLDFVAKTETKVPHEPDFQNMSCFTVVPGGCIAYGGNFGRINLFELSTQVCTVLGSHEKKVTALVALPGGRLASASHDGCVNVWDVDGRALLRTLVRLDVKLVQLMLTPDGHLVVSAERGFVSVWRTDNYTLFKSFKASAGAAVRLPVPSSADTIGSYIPKIQTDEHSIDDEEYLGRIYVTHNSYLSDGQCAKVYGHKMVFIDGRLAASFKHIDQLVPLTQDSFLVVGSGVFVLRRLASPASLFLAMTAAGVPAVYILQVLSSCIV